MNINQWRESDQKVKDAAEVLAHPTVRQMLDAVEETSPLISPPALGGVQRCPNAQAEELGFIKGYHQCLRSLRSLGAPMPPKPKPVPQNYSPTEVKE